MKNKDQTNVINCTVKAAAYWSCKELQTELSIKIELKKLSTWRYLDRTVDAQWGLMITLVCFFGGGGLLLLFFLVFFLGGCFFWSHCLNVYIMCIYCLWLLLSGWFEGLSQRFLSCDVPKMLLLAGKTLTTPSSFAECSIFYILGYTQKKLELHGCLVITDIEFNNIGFSF